METINVAFHPWLSLLLAGISSFLFVPQPPSSGLDSTVLAALIGVGGVILGALITGAIAFYQNRYQMKKNAQLETQRVQLEK